VNDLFLIAEIKAVYGTEGFVIIDSFSDFSERFIKLEYVFIEFFDLRKEFFVENIKIINGRIAIKFKGFDSKNSADLLIGKKIYVDNESAVKLSDDTYFIHDLIGSQVYRGSELLGILEDVLIMPANDVYLIKDLKGKKILVPAIKDYIKSFDPKTKKIDLIPDCDLLYDDEN
jgi:16S rRNA processing protein RimM